MRIQVTSRARDPKKTLALPECCGDECDAQSRDIRALLPECDAHRSRASSSTVNCVTCAVCANTKTLHFALPHTAAAVVPHGFIWSRRSETRETAESFLLAVV